MIVGEVQPSREALVRVVLAGASDQTAEIDAVVDTGFTDYITAPSGLVDQLGLRFRETMVYELANGDLEMFNLYEGRVLWDGTWREVVVSSTEGGSLIGMALMQGCHLSVDVIDGGRVEIRSLSK